MIGKKRLKFQIYLQYTVGTPQGLNRVHTLGTVWVENVNTTAMKELEQIAVERLLEGQPYLRDVIKVGGAKVWAKAID